MGLLVGFELAGANRIWESGWDMACLSFWLFLLFGIIGALVGGTVTLIGTARKAGAGKTIFWTFTVVMAVLIFVDRFGWCYPCHQFLDNRAPHLIYTPLKSFALTAVLGMGCLAVGAVFGAVAYLVWKSWEKRITRYTSFTLLAISLVALASMSRLSMPRLFEPTGDQSQLQSPERLTGLDQVIIIVDDGLTWDLIDPLIAEGELPNYRFLSERGVRGDLATISPTISPAIWTTISTGVSPLRHGIGGFINYALPGMRRGISCFPCPTRMMLPFVFIRLNSIGFGSPRHIGPSLRRAPAIWNIAGKNGIDVGVVGWRYTWPVERVNGFMVAPKLVHEKPIDHVFPRRLEQSVSDVIENVGEPRIDRLLNCPRDSLINDERARGRISLLSHFIVHDLRKHAVAKEFYQSFKPTLMALGMSGVDALEHLFYYEHSLYHYPDDYKLGPYLSRFTSARLRDGLGSVIENAYVLHDSLMGFWKDCAGPRSALIILSDHGHKMDGNAHYYAPPGILLCYGAPFRGGAQIQNASVFDIAPTVLYLLGLPVSLDMEGRVLEEAIRPTWLASYPVRTIDTYGTAETDAKKETPRVDQEYIDRLRALGYVR